MSEDHIFSSPTISPINPVGTQSGFLKYSFALNMKISLHKRHAIIPDNTDKEEQLSDVSLQLNRCETTNALQTGNIRMNRKIENFPNKPFLASLEFPNIRRC